MKKILELIAQFCDKATITADEKATLEAAFSEMAAEDKTEALTAAVEEIKAKFSEEGADAATAADGAGADDTASTEDKGDPASAVTTETETAADPAKVEGETTTDPAPAAVEPEKVVEANEKGEVTIQASEYQSLKALASQTAKLVSAARKSSLDQAVSGLVFSESNKVGVALPKNKQEIVDFALSLSEKGAEKFLAILGKLQTVAASEVGHSEDTANFAEENAEKVAFFMEKMGFSKDEAIKAVQDASAIKDGQK